MGDEGLEPLSSFPSNTTIGPQGGAESGAIEKNSDLSEVVAAWGILSPADRAAIMFRLRLATGANPTSDSP